MNADVERAVESIGFALRAVWEPHASVHAEWAMVTQALRDQEAEIARLREECASQQRIAIQEQILAEKAEALLRRCRDTLSKTRPLRADITAHLGAEQ